MAKAVPPDYPMKWFGAMVSNAASGEFTPGLCVAVARNRETQARQAAERQAKTREEAEFKRRRADPAAKQRNREAMAAASAALGL